MAELSEGARDLLRSKAHAWATTVRPDGSLHNTVVWVDVDGDDVIFNTAVGRAKERHLRQDDRVSISVLDPENPFHLVSVSGTARLDTSDGDAVIDRLAKKYLDADSYPYRRSDEQRITVRITPDRVLFNPGR
jgi:PPOX class probable F420-dependent enzyme